MSRALTLIGSAWLSKVMDYNAIGMLWEVWSNFAMSILEKPTSNIGRWWQAMAFHRKATSVFWLGLVSIPVRFDVITIHLKGRYPLLRSIDLGSSSV